MKSSSLSLVLLFTLLCNAGAAAAGVTVAFVKPERYLDMRRYWSDAGIAVLKDLDDVRKKHAPAKPALSNLWPDGPRLGFDWLASYRLYATHGAFGYYATNPLHGAFETMMQDEAAMQHAAIAVEKINGPVQFVSAAQDEMWPSKEMADAMMMRLQARAFDHAFEHLVVQGGHAEPLDEFPKMEAFLETHFKQACR